MVTLNLLFDFNFKDNKSSTLNVFVFPSTVTITCLYSTVPYDKNHTES